MQANCCEHTSSAHDGLCQISLTSQSAMMYRVNMYPCMHARVYTHARTRARTPTAHTCAHSYLYCLVTYSTLETGVSTSVALPTRL